MEVMNFITENALILVPALYTLGLMFKGTEKIADRYIPIILLPIGIIGASALMGIGVNAVVQGILVTGAAVYVNQVTKQVSKKE